jgi:hypothetical protein
VLYAVNIDNQSESFGGLAEELTVYFFKNIDWLETGSYTTTTSATWFGQEESKGPLERGALSGRVTENVTFRTAPIFPAQDDRLSTITFLL